MTAASEACARRLAANAAALYRGGFARRFAKAKLTRDPLFATLSRTGAIPDAACLIDLGCGQGLLAAWLHAARHAWLADDAHADWPVDWPPPPKVATYLGIDRSRPDIGRARSALPSFARVFRGDVRTMGPTLLDRCDVVTLFDVLHYLEPAAQEALLAAIAVGLPPWGVLVMRVGDADGRLGSYRSSLVDLVVAALRGFPRLRLHRRPVADWTALLAAHGFRVEVIDDPRVRGVTTSADVLLRASRPEAATSSTPAGVR